MPRSLNAPSSHASLSGVTSGQHHAQLHATTHEPAGGDAMAVDAAIGTGSLRTIALTALAAASGDHYHLSGLVRASVGDTTLTTTPTNIASVILAHPVSGLVCVVYGIVLIVTGGAANDVIATARLQTGGGVNLQADRVQLSGAIATGLTFGDPAIVLSTSHDVTGPAGSGERRLTAIGVAWANAQPAGATVNLRAWKDVSFGTATCAGWMVALAASVPRSAGS